MPDRSPITAVGTTTAAFLGVTTGPPEAQRVRTWRDFSSRWPVDTELAAAVEEYFRGGGTDAWAVPVPRLSTPSVRRAASALPRDVALVAIVGDRPAPPAVVVALAAVFAGRPTLLLVEGPWPDTSSALSATAATTVAAVGVASPDAAVFWPRVARGGSAAPTRISPLGPVAGMIARTDLADGPWRSPAGTAAVLRGVRDALVDLRDTESAALGAVHVNTIRRVGDAVVVWGARTLSSDPEWRYLAVRRTAVMLEESVRRGLQWAAFEPNDDALWNAVRRDVQAFLLGFFRAGAFAGPSPADAFFVRCDRSTMTQIDLDAGRIIVQFGFAPVRPAEFVVRTVMIAGTPP